MLQSNFLYTAFFRVAIGILLLIDAITSLYFATDLYMLENYSHAANYGYSWLDGIRQYFHYFFGLYIITLVLWVLGIGKNITSFMVFLFICVEFMLVYPATFWGDNVLRTTLLFFIFVNSFHFFSLKRDNKKATLVHQLALLSIMLHICFLYGVNAFHKLENVEWLSGYALVYFFEVVKTTDIFHIGAFITYKQELARCVAWAIIIFQITFPFLIWFRKLKWWLMLFGIITHTIMALVLQVYKFELIIILHYGFFVPDLTWQNLFKKLNFKDT